MDWELRLSGVGNRQSDIYRVGDCRLKPEPGHGTATRGGEGASGRGIGPVRDFCTKAEQRRPIIACYTEAA